jgi:hypothetical protein
MKISTSASVRRALGSALVAGSAATLLFSGTTFAAKPAPAATTNSITLNGAASFGSTASFTVVDPPVSSVQEVSVTCGQTTQVYLDVHTQNDANWTQFNLWSQAWQDAGGGPANCTAQLYYYTWQGHQETGLVIEATTTFTTS